MRVVRLPGIHHDASCVVISGDDATFVVDPGTSWYQSNVLERIETNVSDQPDIAGILLTHRHYDSAGGACFLSEHLGVPVHAHELAVPALSGGDLFTTWASRFNSDMPSVNATPFEDGTTFDLGNCSIEVLHLPGHTSDSCGFWFEERGVLVAGDLIPRKGNPSRWDFPTGCLPDLLESVEIILGLELEQLIPGHGETIRGTADIRAELEQHQETLAGCVERKGERPETWPRPHPTCNWFTPEPPWQE
jgi:glyoxylase-like metal-dependent hydrolase (beta-lactamase superfamily II)